jgi:hypothetical protein
MWVTSTRPTRRVSKHTYRSSSRKQDHNHGDEEDGDDTDDVNILGYPFEDFGFTIRSLRETPYDVLLSYKIERPVFTGLEYDTEFSLNTVSPTPLPLTECLIEIDERKFGYLAREKTESLRRIGLLGGDDPCKLQTMIELDPEIETGS